MPRKKSEGVRSVLESVWRNSKPQALARLAAVERFVEALRSGNVDRQAQDAALAEAHRLAGSLGMFGFHAASACAAQIEVLLDSPETPDLATAAGLVDRLRTMLDQAVAGTDTTES